jgi:hypothetical protein
MMRDVGKEWVKGERGRRTERERERERQKEREEDK